MWIAPPLNNLGDLFSWKKGLAGLNALVSTTLRWFSSSTKRRSSTVLFWDMSPRIDHKALPMPPQEEVPLPPLPLAQRRLLEARGGSKPTKRLSWSEQQINRLQMDNRELRQKIIDQKRIDLEKDNTITLLREQNARYIREIDRQSEATRFADSIIVAVQDFQQSASRQSDSSSNYHDDTLDGRETLSDAVGRGLNEVIRIYGQM
jgi:hypothetical protein